VLICIDSLGVGGKERQAVELIKGLTQYGRTSVRVVCLNEDEFYLPDLTALGVVVDFVPRRVRWDPRVFAKLQHIIRTFWPDVIHTNGLVSSFYCLPLAKRWHIPVVNGSIRNAFTGGGLRWKLERFLLNASDYRVANSRAGLRSRNLGENDPRNSVIYNGFDFSRVKNVKPNRGHATVAATGETKVVGMVAEFSQCKDYLTFIEAARLFDTNRRDVMFVTVGDGVELNECQKAATGLSNIRFLGKRRDVEELIQTFDIGVLCTFVEGLSNSIMEYMAFGKPVVATDGGGTRELVTDGATGVLVRERDSLALAEVIEYLIDNPDIAARMGYEGQVRLRREFALERMVDDTLALYTRAVTNRKGRLIKARTSAACSSEIPSPAPRD